MVDFIWGPGKILKYDPKKVNFALLGSFFGLGPGKNYRLSPPLYLSIGFLILKEGTKLLFMATSGFMSSKYLNEL
jgi:hypothetical protein